jgi:outer membrane immunogenic protein
MRHFSIAIIAASTLAFSQIASAADMAVKAPPPPPVPVYSWTGFYVGGNVGYSRGNANSTYNEPWFAVLSAALILPLPASFSASERLDGVIGGGQIGYNWQPNATWVLGLEADIQGSGERGITSYSNPLSYFCPNCGVFPPPIINGAINQTQEVKILWFGTVRGRAGILVNPTLWLYGTGGLAYGRISASGTVTDTACTAGPTTQTACMWSYGNSATNVGWTVGAGIEGLVPNTTNWTWKVEYLYIDFGTVRGTGYDTTSFVNPYSWSASVTDNIVRVGLNYGFH